MSYNLRNSKKKKGTNVKKTTKKINIIEVDQMDEVDQPTYSNFLPPIDQILDYSTTIYDSFQIARVIGAKSLEGTTIAIAGLSINSTNILIRVVKNLLTFDQNTDYMIRQLTILDNLLFLHIIDKDPRYASIFS